MVFLVVPIYRLESADSPSTGIRVRANPRDSEIQNTKSGWNIESVISSSRNSSSKQLQVVIVLYIHVAE